MPAAVSHACTAPRGTQPIATRDGDPSVRRPRRGASGADRPRQRPRLVQTAIANPAGVTERAFTGIISARVQSNLGFRVPGKVIERLVDVGQDVQAGQPLVRLDQKDLDLALSAKENAVVAARALAVQARADEARYRQLTAAGWVAPQRYDQAKAARHRKRATGGSRSAG